MQLKLKQICPQTSWAFVPIQNPRPRNSRSAILFFEALIYVSFVLISCALFSKFWIEAAAAEFVHGQLFATWRFCDRSQGHLPGMWPNSWEITPWSSKVPWHNDKLRRQTETTTPLAFVFVFFFSNMADGLLMFVQIWKPKNSGVVYSQAICHLKRHWPFVESLRPPRRIFAPAWDRSFSCQLVVGQPLLKSAI